MRLAIDIDSTLHHYWDRLSHVPRCAASESTCPDQEQSDLGITRLRPDQLRLCIQETHCREVILSGRPYETRSRPSSAWRSEGHFIQITSHRDAGARGSTADWLAQIGLPYDDLQCSDDKVRLCVDLGIELLIDDSPVNLAQAIEHGILVATIAHPWNRDLCEEEDVICADDWRGLAAKLDPLLRRRARIRP